MNLLNSNNEMDPNYLKKFRIRQVVSRLGFNDRAGLKAYKLIYMYIYTKLIYMYIYTFQIHFSRKIYNKNIPKGFKSLEKSGK